MRLKFPKKLKTMSLGPNLLVLIKKKACMSNVEFQSVICAELNVYPLCFHSKFRWPKWFVSTKRKCHGDGTIKQITTFETTVVLSCASVELNSVWIDTTLVRRLKWANQRGALRGFLRSNWPQIAPKMHTLPDLPRHTPWVCVTRLSTFFTSSHARAFDSHASDLFFCLTLFFLLFLNA